MPLRNARSKQPEDAPPQPAEVVSLPRPRKPAPAAKSVEVRPVADSAAPVGEVLAAPSPAAARKPRRTAQIAMAGALPPATIPRESLVSPRRDWMFLTALSVSLIVHAIAGLIHFSPFDAKRAAEKEPPLEVALVNAKSSTKPTKAELLAQANLDGGGNTDQKRRAKTPLPVMPKDAPAKDVNVAAETAEAKRDARPELMTQIRPGAAVAPAPTPVDVEKTDSPTANEMMQKTLEAIRLEAQIAKDLDAYQKRPKRRFIGARAEEYRFARYVEDWRLKIERIGNLNYPEAARAQKLYGSLVLTVSIRSDGSLENVEVSRTSGQRILDAAAVKIVEMSGPFAAFPPDIKRDTDILHITRTWTFAKGDELTSQ